jgi:hypothetical protein
VEKREYNTNPQALHPIRQHESLGMSSLNPR